MAGDDLSTRDPGRHKISHSARPDSVPDTITRVAAATVTRVVPSWGACADLKRLLNVRCWRLETLPADCRILDSAAEDYMKQTYRHAACTEGITCTERISCPVKESIRFGAPMT